MLAIPLVLLSVSAHAEDTYQCKAFLPRGSATVTVLSDDNGPSRLVVKFHNDGLNEDFDGEFKITYFRAGPVGTGGVVAEGEFNAQDGDIQAVIQGSLTPNESGNILLYVTAGWDHRIESGYGNRLTCVKDEF